MKEYDIFVPLFYNDGSAIEPAKFQELQHWLLANHFDWKVSALASDSIKTTEDSESRVVNVTLTQWPNLINR